MNTFSIYRITSDRELFYIDDISAHNPQDAIKDAIRQYPYLEPFKPFLLAVPHQQVAGYSAGAIFSLDGERTWRPQN